MATVLFAAGAIFAVWALALKERERVRLLMVLDAERFEHKVTRGERDGLRGALDRAVGERERLENEIAELRALREGGPYR